MSNENTPAKTAYQILTKWIIDRVERGELKKNTAYYYTKLIDKLNSIVGGEKETFDLDKISKFDLSGALLDNTDSNENLIKGIIMFYKILDRRPPKNISDLRDLRKRNADQIHTEQRTRAKKVLPYKYFSEIVDIYNEKTKDLDKLLNSFSPIPRKAIKKYLAFSLYSLLPPLRPSEYLSTKIYLKSPTTVPKLVNFVYYFVYYFVFIFFYLFIS